MVKQSDGSGLATLDKSCRYAGAYPQVVKKIEAGKLAVNGFQMGKELTTLATEGAKADRLGIFE